jgi:hypothetical protein
MSARSRPAGHSPLARTLALGFVAVLAACAACGDGEGTTAGPTVNAGGATASSSATGSPSATSSATTGGGAGGDHRDWTNLEWPGLPCSLLTAGPATTPTLIWKPCAVAGCSFIDPSPFMPGSFAVTTTHQQGNVITALVHREGGYDSVVWDATTGQERWAIRGHPDCMPKRAFPFVINDEARAWFGVRTSGGSLANHAYYEVDLSEFTATKLNIPESMSSQQMAGDADHLALGNSIGPNVGIWSRATETFTYLSNMVAFEPRTGPGGVLLIGPDAGGDLDVFWWQNGSVVPAVTATPGTWAVTPVLAGGDLIWTEAPNYGEPGVVKRAPFTPSAFPLTGEVVVSLAQTSTGGGSDRFYLEVALVNGAYRLQIVNLETNALTNYDLPEEIKWPSAIDFVGKDAFGDKEVAWIQANDTVYRVELEP